MNPTRMLARVVIAVGLTSATLSTAEELLQLQKLQGSDTPIFSTFGFGVRSVAMDGDTLVVGSSYPGFVGSAYIFEAEPVTGRWNQVDRVIGAEEGSGVRFFGKAIALDDGTFIVGAPETDSVPGALDDIGAAFLFERDPVTGRWIRIGRFASPVPTIDGQYGTAVTMEGSTMAISEMGKAHVYDRSPSTGRWQYSATLTPFDGREDTRFGHRIELSGEWLFVTANHDSDMGNQAGALYLYRRDATTGAWSGVAKLFASDADTLGYFGGELSVFGDCLVVRGADYAYVLELDVDSGEWQETAQLDTFETFHSYGIALDEGRVVIGHSQLNFSTGSADVYARDDATGDWELALRLKASDAQNNDDFGESVEIDQGRFAIAAPGHVSELNSNGAVYVFGPSELGGSATGVQVLSVSGENETSGQEVMIDPTGATAWDFAASGLVATVGDELKVRLIGTATDDSGISGAVAEWRLEYVACSNDTTGDLVNARISADARTWDCSVLEAERGDSIRIHQVGVAGRSL